jgi:hypothetical protein
MKWKSQFISLCNAYKYELFVSWKFVISSLYKIAIKHTWSFLRKPGKSQSPLPLLVTWRVWYCLSFNGFYLSLLRTGVTYEKLIWKVIQKGYGRLFQGLCPENFGTSAWKTVLSGDNSLSLKISQKKNMRNIYIKASSLFKPSSTFMICYSHQIFWMTKSRLMRWTGHVASMEAERNAYKVVVG